MSHLLLARTQGLTHGQRYIQANVTLSSLYHALLKHKLFTTNFFFFHRSSIVVFEGDTVARKI